MNGSRQRLLGFTLREHVCALAVFALVTLAFFAPVLGGDTFSDVAGRQQGVYPWAGLPASERFSVLHYDQADTAYPWQVYINRTLRDGELPLWNPYSFGGTPFLANGQSSVLYPPRLVLSLVASPTRVHDILLATHLFLAGVAMLLLLGAARLSFPAALVGSLAWMLNSFALAWQALEHYIVIEAWFPLGLLLAHTVVRRRSWAPTVGLALVLALMYAGGNVLFVELAVTAIAGYAVALAIARARNLRALAPGLARLAAALLLSVGIGAMALLPTFSLASESARASLDYSELGQFALPWHALANIFQTPSISSGDPYHRDLFSGTAIGFLALAGLCCRNLLARYAAALGFVAILFMLHTPVTFVVEHVLPGFDNFKPLARAAFLLQFALAILAAYGFDATRRFLVSASNRRLLRLPFMAGVVAGIVVQRLVHGTGHQPGIAGALSLGLAFALAGALAFELIARRLRGRGGQPLGSGNGSPTASRSSSPW